MTHISFYIKSLKISWIKRLLNTDSAWKHIFYHTLETDQLKIESFGNYAKLLAQRTTNDFWKETLVAFGDYQLLLQPKNR